jgi:hypothetical protein
MNISRRRLIQSVALTVGQGAALKGAEPAISVAILRDVSAMNGSNLSDDRLRVVKPVLEQRLPPLNTLRDFVVDDAVAPTQGILDHA